MEPSPFPGTAVDMKLYCFLLAPRYLSKVFG